jgi:hypothetical protein
MVLRIGLRSLHTTCKPGGQRSLPSCPRWPQGTTATRRRRHTSSWGRCNQQCRPFGLPAPAPAPAPYAPARSVLECCCSRRILFFIWGVMWPLCWDAPAGQRHTRTGQGAGAQQRREGEGGGPQWRLTRWSRMREAIAGGGASDIAAPGSNCSPRKHADQTPTAYGVRSSAGCGPCHVGRDWLGWAPKG